MNVVQKVLVEDINSSRRLVLVDGKYVILDAHSDEVVRILPSNSVLKLIEEGVIDTPESYILPQDWLTHFRESEPVD